MKARRGTTLVEAIAAIAILGVALFLAASLRDRGPGADRRLEAHRVALRSAEGALEAVRAGAVPAVNGPFVPPGAPGPKRDVVVRLEVRPAGAPDLLEVSATATVPAGDRPVRERVTTLCWRPR